MIYDTHISMRKYVRRSCPGRENKKKETYKFITYIIVYSIPYYDSNSMFFPLSKQTPNNHKIY